MTSKNRVQPDSGADMNARLSVVDGRDHALVTELGPDQIGRGLYEGNPYVLQCHPTPVRLYVDDVAVHPCSPGCYEWVPDFYAGLATISADFADGRSADFLLTISPPQSKASDTQLAEMVDAIRDFDTELLLGDSPAKMRFGKEEIHDAFTSLIQFQRMRRYGPRFVESLRRLTQSPHQGFVSAAQLVPLTRVRQLHPDNLRDRRVSALLTLAQLDADELDSTPVRSRNPVRSVDTPANRSLTALVRRVKARNHSLLESLERGFPGNPGENLPRQPRREAVLRGLSESLAGIARKEPFSVFKGQVQTSAAGLTQIAASPLYQQAYRLGTLALSAGVNGQQVDDLSVCYSWGIYEVWCLITVLTTCRAIASKEPQYTASSWVTSERCYEFEVGADHRLQVHFQAKFPSIAPLKNKACWSISRERYPDILLLDIRGESVRALVLDAKWRSGRNNLFEAMESAHIYHDALRIQGRRPSPCLLLAPGNSDVPEIAADRYMTDHEVGIVFEFLPSGAGVSRLANLVHAWMAGSAPESNQVGDEQKQ